MGCDSLRSSNRVAMSVTQPLSTFFHRLKRNTKAVSHNRISLDEKLLAQTPLKSKVRAQVRLGLPGISLSSRVS